MKQYITPHAIANTIRLLRTHATSTVLIVEGDSDARLYKHFVDRNHCHIEIAHSKHNAVAALELLEQDSVAGVLAIVDADFDRLENRLPSRPNLLCTDGHDLEMMTLRSPALEKVLAEFGSEQKIAAFTQRHSQDIRAFLLEQGIHLGYLRWLSLRENLALRFEELSFSKFLDRETLTVEVLSLVTAVKHHSQKPALLEKDIQRRLEQLRADDHDPWDVCCGHDVIALLAEGLQRALGTNKAAEARAELIERSLRLAYEYPFFTKTRLYAAMIAWEKDNRPFIIFAN